LDRAETRHSSKLLDIFDSSALSQSTCKFDYKRNDAQKPCSISGDYSLRVNNLKDVHLTFYRGLRILRHVKLWNIIDCTNLRYFGFDVKLYRNGKVATMCSNKKNSHDERLVSVTDACQRIGALAYRLFVAEMQ
jgi:hypothetical protein